MPEGRAIPPAAAPRCHQTLTPLSPSQGWTCPSPDSTRDDLRYCEHKVEPLEDITVRSRRDGLPLRRELTNPLDLAVLRLAALEQNLERRYLKEPLWPLHEVVVEKAVLSGPEELSLGPTEM